MFEVSTILCTPYIPLSILSSTGWCSTLGCLRRRGVSGLALPHLGHAGWEELGISSAVDRAIIMGSLGEIWELGKSDYLNAIIRLRQLSESFCKDSLAVCFGWERSMQTMRGSWVGSIKPEVMQLNSKQATKDMRTRSLIQIKRHTFKHFDCSMLQSNCFSQRQVSAVCATLVSITEEPVAIYPLSCINSHRQLRANLTAQGPTCCSRAEMCHRNSSKEYGRNESFGACATNIPLEPLKTIRLEEWFDDSSWPQESVVWEDGEVGKRLCRLNSIEGTVGQKRIIWIHLIRSIIYLAMSELSAL